MQRSAGILPFRSMSGLEVLIAHPGGPFFTNRSEGSWSVVKGQIEPGEDPWTTARREFTEETGWPILDWEPIELGTVVQAGGKHVTAFAIETDLDIATFTPGMFLMSWRGRVQSFPEIDEVRWTDLVEAAGLLNPAQVPLLDRLASLVAARS